MDIRGSNKITIVHNVYETETSIIHNFEDQGMSTDKQGLLSSTLHW